MSEPIRIATRQSPLALWQAEEVQSRLKLCHPDLSVELVPMTTRGDQIQGTPLARIGGKGLFVKELEAALLDGRADLAVHSMKDVVAVLPEQLQICTVLEREDPYDALVSAHYETLDELPEDAVVGTCSPRREAQLHARYPGFQIRTLRGNVNTRLARLDKGDFDAIILACAGLKRLNLAARIRQSISPDTCLPAVGQGIIGIEVRADDSRVKSLLAPLHDAATATRLTAERAFSLTLNGGCSAPIAAFAELAGDVLSMTGRVISLDGKNLLATAKSATPSNAHQLGVDIARYLLAEGAQAILDDAEQRHRS